jgi:cation diffusion facilitator CzcD-associated flavoprotein CzcO
VIDALIDAEALRTRYLAERDKRLRSEGNEQYVEVVGEFARFVDDPHTTRLERPSVHDDVMFAFIGGGFAGLTAGAALKEAGITDVRLIEKGGDVGGTWYWNRYPGAQCDTTSFVYLPLLEETGHMPSEKYAHGPEILDHCRRIAKHFALYDNALLSTEVTAVVWNDETKRWTITTNRGDQFHAKFVAMGTGPLHRPKLPGIDGINSFIGHTFHTSRWDYDYTGGDQHGAPMVHLQTKRVGIIGTGATAVQCVPHLSRSCQELFVFQRTPSSIDVRNNCPTDPDWFATLEKGWQDAWLLNFTTLQTGGMVEKDLVMDGWTDITKRIRAKLLSSPNPDLSPAGLERAYHDSDDEKMTEIRARVDQLIKDPNTAEALKPWYRQLCKRPCFHDTYLQAFNNPNTHLIDTDGKGVDRITERGVVVAGVEYELDCVIFATGFEVGTEQHRRAGFDPVGRNGLKLSEKWSEGMRTLHGMHVHGFPNLFVVSPSQAANLISNVPHNLIEAGRTLAAVLDHAIATNATEVEPTKAAEDAWVARLEAGGRRFGNQPDCTPGYYNNEGRGASPHGILGSLGFPEGPVAFFDYIAKWRNSGDFEGLEFRS